jgi:hypothetical protein
VKYIIVCEVYNSALRLRSPTLPYPTLSGFQLVGKQNKGFQLVGKQNKGFQLVGKQNKGFQLVGKKNKGF